jgi:hypothetical protein
VSRDGDRKTENFGIIGSTTTAARDSPSFPFPLTIRLAEPDFDARHAGRLVQGPQNLSELASELRRRLLNCRGRSGGRRGLCGAIEPAGHRRDMGSLSR